MVDWQVTATTTKCDYVDDYAVIMVYKDNTAKCAFVNKHSKTKDGQKRLRNCKWPDCPLVDGFKQRAFTM